MGVAKSDFFLRWVGADLDLTIIWRSLLNFARIDLDLDLKKNANIVIASDGGND